MGTALITMYDFGILPAVLAAVTVGVATAFFGYRLLAHATGKTPPLAVANQTMARSRSAADRAEPIGMPLLARPRAYTRVAPASVPTPEATARPTAKAPHLIRIRSGRPILGPHRTPRDPRALTNLHSAPITRVEWDAVASSGRDPFEWFIRLPREQTLLPVGEVIDSGEATSIRFKAGSNLTVWRWRD